MDTWVIILRNNGSLSTQCERLAREVVAPSHILTVGPETALWRAPGARVGRPEDRGTTPDLLLGLFQVLARDLSATVVVLPADLDVPSDVALGEAIEAALIACDEGAGQTILIATEPSDDGQPRGPLTPRRRVLSIRDTEEQSNEGLGYGVYVDTSIIVAQAWSLANLVHDRVPAWFRALRRVVWTPEIIAEAFERLGPSDLVNDVLVPSVDHLHVVPAFRGWRPLPAWRHPSRIPLNIEAME